jgi:UrcA family protein
MNVYECRTSKKTTKNLRARAAVDAQIGHGNLMVSNSGFGDSLSLNRQIPNTLLPEEAVMKSNMKTHRRARLVLRTATLVAFGLVGSYAFADDQLRTETVKFQDLNVDTTAGVETLYGRIHSAVKRVCSETDRMEQARASTCARKAEARAVESLNLPLLTTYYRVKTGGITQALRASR